MTTKAYKCICVVIAAFLLPGCAAFQSSMDTHRETYTTGPSVKDLIDKIECEIINSKKELNDKEYIAAVDLTVDVVDSGGINPNLSYITPYQSAGTSLTESISAQLSGIGHRNFNISYVYDLSILPEPNNFACKESKISGMFGLGEVIEKGISYTHEGECNPLTSKEMKKEDSIAKIPLYCGKDKKIDPGSVPKFGATIDFTIVKGIGGVGPNWTLRHFKGPNSGGPGLFSLARTEKHTLVISFVPIRAGGNSDAAQDNNTKMILRNLIPTRGL